MKGSLVITVLACIACSSIPMCAKSQSGSNSIEPVTVLSVESQTEVQPSYMGGGDNPSDAPLRSEVYSYDVAVHSDCATLVTRHQSPYDYFPSAFSPNAQIPARITKHEVDFVLPSGREMKMPIVSRKRSSAPGCEVQR
jgi:hypothetical protein